MHNTGATAADQSKALPLFCSPCIRLQRITSPAYNIQDNYRTTTLSLKEKAQMDSSQCVAKQFLGLVSF